MSEETKELLSEEIEDNNEELENEESTEEVDETQESEESEESQEDDVHEDFQGLGKNGKLKAQKRFNKISAEKYKALEDAAAERSKNRELQDRLEAIESRLSPQDTQTVQTQSKKPLRDDYETDDEWFEALADHKAEEKVNKAFKAKETKEEKNRMQKQQTEKQNSLLDNFKAKTMECISKYDDYLDTTASVPVAMDSELGQEILHSKEHCGEIMRVLGQDPDLLNNLSGLSGRELTKAFGRLEASLETKQKKAPLKNKKQAPGPANTNRKATKYTGPPKIHDLSPDEHYRLSCEGKL